MSYSILESVNPGTATVTATSFSTVPSSTMPSDASLAKEAVNRMLKDDDVRQLPEEVRQSTQRFSAEVARCFPSSRTSRIAVFGDADDGVGSVVFLDRATARQIELTIHADRASVWMRGPAEKLTFEDVRPEQVPLLSAIFSRLR